MAQTDTSRIPEAIIPKVRDVIPERSLAPRYQRAAQLVAEDILTDEEIAEECGCSRRQLARWKDRQDFSFAVSAIRISFKNQVMAGGLARREIRVAKLQKQHRDLELAIKERSKAGASTGDTGYVVKRHKMIGSGPAAKEVTEYEIDVGTSRELREISEQIAVECGQRVEEHNHTHKIFAQDMNRQELKLYAETGVLPERFAGQFPKLAGGTVIDAD